MVRLVFRPYTQVRRTICTSVSLRASTRVSSGFALLRHSSPSFGSQQVCSYSNLSQKIMVGRRCAEAPACQVPCASWVFYPPTRIHVRLLGPCFETGRLKAFRQRHSSVSQAPCTAEADDSRAQQTHADQPPALIGGSMNRIKPGGTRCFQTLPPQQFQALFNSLFKVLFIFPSRYLFAIGLSPIFSL